MTAGLPRPGDTFESPSKTLTDAHFLLFSGVTGDVHPIPIGIAQPTARRR